MWFPKITISTFLMLILSQPVHANWLGDLVTGQQQQLQAIERAQKRAQEEAAKAAAKATEDARLATAKAQQEQAIQAKAAEEKAAQEKSAVELKKAADLRSTEEMQKQLRRKSLDDLYDFKIKDVCALKLLDCGTLPIETVRGYIDVEIDHLKAAFDVADKRRSFFTGLASLGVSLIALLLSFLAYRKKDRSAQTVNALPASSPGNG